MISTEAIRPIETVYKGSKFRSRLEARWAVFFDAMDLKWVYEPKGFKIGKHAYLPDFYLPECEVWCEVKGDALALADDKERMMAVLNEGGPLPLILLSDIPNVGDEGTIVHPCFVLSRKQELARTYAAFIRVRDSSSIGILPFSDDVMARNFSFAIGLFQFDAMHEGPRDQQERKWNARHIALRTSGAWPETAKAYSVAKQARFEHGANGQ